MVRLSKIVGLAAAAVLLGGAAGPAKAALITQTYNITASDFSPSAPVDPVTGSVTVTLDNSSNIGETTSGITVNSFNIAIGSTVAFIYSTFGDALIIGGTQNSLGGIFSDTNDFFARILGASTATPNLFEFIYSQSDPDHIFFAQQLSITLGTPTPVLEPSSIALLGVGVLGVWLLRFRKAA